MRKVTVWSTKGKKKSVYETEAKTWGELQTVINEDYDLNSLKATENVNKTSLEHVDAVIPEGDFVLFLRPEKTKSGADVNSMSFKELRAELTDADKAQLKIDLKGRNWTQAKTSELKDFLNNRATTPPPAEAAKPASPAKAEAVEVEENEVEKPVTHEERVAKAKSLLQEVRDDSDDDELIERLAIALEEIDSVLEMVSESFANAAADEAETKRLEEEAEDLMSGF